MKLNQEMKAQLKDLCESNDIAIISAKDVKDDEGETWFRIQFNSDSTQEQFLDFALDNYFEEHPDIEREVEYDDEGHSNYLFFRN